MDTRSEQEDTDGGKTTFYLKPTRERGPTSREEMVTFEDGTLLKWLLESSQS
ncbi:hypothetical protein JOB18_006791 [Solea senegalensis]|uniref:Uncharacterized protein n=1 Tax=Solea senegalensis TaxID=28829 RepID=A0AAV6SY05_SOLSE|nr:hypothetical protein JOB18_006791 [Solea senegalensis]